MHYRSPRNKLRYRHQLTTQSCGPGKCQVGMGTKTRLSITYPTKKREKAKCFLPFLFASSASQWFIRLYVIPDMRTALSLSWRKPKESSRASGKAVHVCKVTAGITPAEVQSTKNDRLDTNVPDNESCQKHSIIIGFWL